MVGWTISQGAGGDVAPEHDFTVTQDTEFDEFDVPEDDDERPIDDALVDDRPGGSTRNGASI